MRHGDAGNSRRQTANWVAWLSAFASIRCDNVSIPRTAALTLALLCGVFGSAAHAECLDTNRIDQFKNLFVADEGLVRKWDEPISVFVDGEGEYKEVALSILRYYSSEFGVDMEVQNKNAKIYILTTNDLYRTLLKHGEKIFYGGFETSEDFYEFLKANALKDRGYVSATRFVGHVPQDTAIVIGANYYSVDTADQILNTLIARILFPGHRKEDSQNAHSIFFETSPSGQMNSCDHSLIEMFSSDSIEPGMSWNSVLEVIENEER